MSYKDFLISYDRWETKCANALFSFLGSLIVSAFWIVVAVLVVKAVKWAWFF